MAWLGVVFALVVGFEIAVDVSPTTARALEWTGWAIWAIFVIEFGARLLVAPDRRRFLRSNWFQAAALLVPTLRVFRFLRLFRLGRALPAARVVSSSYRSVGTARKLLRSRLGYLGGVSVIAVVALAQLIYVFEHTKNPAFESFGDSLFWSAAVVLGLQGDPLPESAGGRALMLVGFAFGLVIVASLAGTVGAFLVEERRERASGGDEPAAADERRPAAEP